LKMKARTSTVLQFVAIVIMSIAASYGFQHTETTYRINGLCFYRYVAYAIVVCLGYICFSRYRRYLGLAFSFTLSALALSPISQETIGLFVSLIPLLAVMMGVTTVLVFPSSGGKEFFGFLGALILPAVVAESRIAGSFHLFGTIQSIGYHELSAITVIIVGGYFYLRYAAMVNLSSLEFLSKGASEREVAEVSKQCNIVIIIITAVASGVAAFSMVTVPIVSNALRATFVTLPLYVLGLTLGVGVALTTAFYLLQIYHKRATRGYLLKS